MTAAVSALTAVIASGPVGDLAVSVAVFFLVCFFAGFLIGGIRVILDMINEKEP